MTTNPDGSVELIVEWDRLDDPAGLAADLRQAGVPTEVRTGLPERFCPGVDARGYTSEALNRLGPEGKPVSTDGYTMQPELFPDGSILVISTYADTQTQVFYTMMYLAPAASTSCTLTGTLGECA
ncbi:hypothetical protein O7632_30395 [Solwaraspora sp. WMMD406]|uniref:hypothetical protein n=1 Tax=Solwaraspora sp. WMMD406 TaxID=3016095 RepID=UPI002416623A|nr:hypothetical protein [Solwaraspora sp. WMMD406]MDG4768370.1 hypothetical protein [Solwaraspora sp. WMMD406]